MNRNWNRRAIGGLPILSGAVLSTVGLLWIGAHSQAEAQATGEVVVNYDVLNNLPSQAAPPPQSQFLGTAPATLPPYTSYEKYGATGTPPPMPGATPGLAPGLAAPPSGAPSSVLTTLGPDGRPIIPIKLKKPGSQTTQKTKKESFAAPIQTQAAATPPTEPEAPAEMPTEVPMPEPTPPAPPPGENADMPVAAPVATPEAPAEAPVDQQAAAEQPEEQQPAEPQSAEQPAEQPAEEQPAEEQPAEAAPAAPPAPEPTQEAAKTPEAPAEEQPAEEPPAEEAAEAPAPDNAQPAPPVPQGGIRIVFPTELNEVPPEANAALDDLAAQMQADENMRIQIMCYASGTEDTESKARRRSLARCINVRQYLFKKDIRTTRMDVRALGLKSEGQPADRVDIVPANS